ncbi:MAG: Mannitol-phosphate 5-dehydrogenase [Firmicutes bacterium]|nr:Mannitol-phosphate 5-dehydrogenase [Bacillota bacterium]
MLAVHFGAGNIGRGFIGQLLYQAGYEVSFVDVSKELVDEIKNRKEYTVMLAAEEKTAFTVKNVSAIDGKDEEAVIQAIAKADLVTTAIGPNILKFVAPVIAKGISLRLKQSDKALNVIACENMVGGSSALKSFVYTSLDDADKKKATEKIGFPDAAVDRIVPLQKNEDKLLVMVEPFYEWVVNRSQMVGEVPAIEGITYVDDLEPFIERKLFTVNTGHATVAYLGYLNGFESIDKAIQDEHILAVTEKTLHETGALMVAKYDFDKDQHEAYIQKIIKRFKNPYISDEVTRVGRSPIRKLSAKDRLVSPAMQAMKHDIALTGLPTVIAAALLFDYKQDTEAVEVQNSIKENGVEKTIEQYTGIAVDHPLFKLIVENYQRLNKK